jgi:hypothetical protein
LEVPVSKERINGREPDFSEEDIPRERFGTRGAECSILNKPGTASDMGQTRRLK